MRIRKFTMEDYKQVYSMWLNTPGMGLRSLDDSEEGIEKYLKRNPETCFVAETENEKRIIGIILSGHDGRRGYIHHTIVEPDARKQGIGTMLVNAAINALKEQGINKVALVVFRMNETGNLFWETQGFEARDDLIYRNKSKNNENR